LLRNQLGLSSKPISNGSLADMAGVDGRALTERSHAAQFSFALDASPIRGRVALRSKWETGRRFELARIIGDRLMAEHTGRLFPATGSYTYRQKAQRSFAAELLSPFDTVDEILDGDFSAESQQDVAHHFSVSELTIRTSLMNHHRIERENWDEPHLGEEF
jgi:hypothetical protein